MSASRWSFEDRVQEAARVVRAYQRRHGAAPRISEVGEIMGLRSDMTTKVYLDGAVEAGLLVAGAPRAARRYRAPVRRGERCPVCGRAGAA